MLSFDKLKPLAYRHIDGSFKRSKNEKVFYILIVIKGDTEMKKTISAIAALLLVVIVGTHGVFADVSEGQKNKVILANDTLVLNVYTSGTPASGNSVTLYTDSNNSYNYTQVWTVYKDQHHPSHNRFSLYYIDNLALNYQQSTQNCTIYPWLTNHNAGFDEDYLIDFVNINGTVNVVRLALRPYYLIHSGANSGSQYKWYTTQNYYSSSYSWSIQTW